MAESLIDARNLRKTYRLAGGKTLAALDDVSLTIPQGAAIGLVGESGSGKSTLARALLRLTTLDGGTVEYQGRDVYKTGKNNLKALRKNLQMVFQDPFASLNPRMKIGEAVSEGLLVHGLADHNQRRTMAADMLQQVGLETSALDRYPHQFSGGQRQRIAIARALTLKPKLLICDEPVSALDVSVQAQILSLLAHFKESMDLTLLFISHDLRVVRQLCSAVVVMRHGRIVEQGETGEIYRDPKEAYTKQLLQAARMKKNK